MTKRRKNNGIKFSAAVILGIFAAYFLMYNPFFQKPVNAAIREYGEETVNDDNLNTMALHPSIAKDDNGYSIITWAGQPNGMNNPHASVYYQVYDDNDKLLLTPPQDQPDPFIADLTGNITTNLGAFHTSPKIKATATGGNFVVVWEDINGNNKYDIYARAFRNYSTPLGAAVKINSVESDIDPLPSIGMNQVNTNNGYTSVVIGWVSTVGNSKTVVVKKMKVKFDQNSPDNLSSDGNETVVATANSQEASVSMNNNDEFMVSWDQQDGGFYQIYMQYYGSDGSAIGTNTKVNSSTLITAQKPTIASDKFANGRNSTDHNPRYYVIAYQGTSADEPDGGIFARIAECKDPNPGNSTDSDITCHLIPVELTANSTTSAFTPPHDPSVDTDELGNFTVGWNDGANNMYGYLYAQNYNFNFGLPNLLHGNEGAIMKSGNQYQVNAATGGTRNNIAISMNAGGQYGVAFQFTGGGGRGGPTAEIDSDQFVSGMLKSGSETLANTKDSHNQTHVSVAVAPDGSHAEVWRSDSTRGIYYTLWDSNDQVVLDSNSQPIQNRRIDNDGDSNDHDYPSVSFFKDTTGNDVGRFIIAWSGSAPTCVTDPDGNLGTNDATYTTEGTDIWYREIAADGTVDGNCEKKVNSEIGTLGADDAPKIDAGYYSNGAMSPTDNFQAVWLHQADAGNPTEATNIYTAFHNGSTPNPADSMSDFTYATLSSSYNESDSGTGHINGCNACSTNSYSVKFLAALNGFTTTWSDINAQNKQGIFGNSILNGSPASPNPILISPQNSKEHFNPDLAIEPTNGTDIMDFILTYTETETDLSAGTIQAMTVTVSNNGNNTLTPYTLTTLNSPGVYPYAHIAAGPFGENYIFYDDTNITFDNLNIYGLILYFDSQSNLQKVANSYLVNSTYAEGDGGAGQHSPSASMNDYGKIFVGWEGNYQLDPSTANLGTDDYQAAIGQSLNDIFYSTAFPNLDQTASQTINAGSTRTLVVPTTIDFDSKTIDTSSHQFSTKSVRDLQSNNFIELIDLQGAPATITVSASDFTLDSDHQTYIHSQNLSVKNCDQDNANDQRCVDTIAGSPSDFDLTSVETANTYCAFNTLCSADQNPSDPKPLATKTGNNVGGWKFYPEFKLDIPPIVPPGTHSATITFTLN